MEIYVDFRWLMKLKVILKMINLWSGFLIGNQILQSI